MKTCSSLQETARILFTFKQDNTPTHKLFKTKNVLARPSQNPILNPTENDGMTWKLLFTNSLHPTWRILRNFAQERSVKTAGFSCAKLFKTYPRRRGALIAPYVGSIKSWPRGSRGATKNGTCCVNQMAKIPVESISVTGCNTTKCGNGQWNEYFSVFKPWILVLKK